MTRIYLVRTLIRPFPPRATSWNVTTSISMNTVSHTHTRTQNYYLRIIFYLCLFEFFLKKKIINTVPFVHERIKQNVYILIKITKNDTSIITTLYIYIHIYKVF